MSHCSHSRPGPDVWITMVAELVPANHGCSHSIRWSLAHTSSPGRPWCPTAVIAGWDQMCELQWSQHWSRPTTAVVTVADMQLVHGHWDIRPGPIPHVPAGTSMRPIVYARPTVVIPAGTVYATNKPRPVPDRHWYLASEKLRLGTIFTGSALPILHLSASRRPDPGVQGNVHPGGTRSATVFDWSMCGPMLTSPHFKVLLHMK